MGDNTSQEGEYGIPDSYLSPIPDEGNPVHRVPFWILLVLLVVLGGVVVYLFLIGNRFPDVRDVLPGQENTSEELRQLEGLNSSNIEMEERVQILEKLSSSENDSGLSREEKLQILRNLQETP